MAQFISVAIVGPGSLGTALARALHASGAQVGQIVYRDAKAARRASSLANAIGASVACFADAEFSGKLVWLCVGDSAIAATALSMANRRDWKGAIVFHSSGALTSDQLAPLRDAGAAVASVHPMMTFVKTAAPSMRGVTFALEGDGSAIRLARRLVKALGGESIVIANHDKPLYHALGAFVSPLIIAQMAATERIGRQLGLSPSRVRRTIAPILRQSIENYLQHGPAAAFSGPIVRGDVETIKRNLRALKRVPGTREVYRVLAKIALQDLPSKDAKGVKKIIEERGSRSARQRKPKTNH